MLKNNKQRGCGDKWISSEDLDLSKRTRDDNPESPTDQIMIATQDDIDGVLCLKVFLFVVPRGWAPKRKGEIPPKSMSAGVVVISAEGEVVCKSPHENEWVHLDVSKGTLENCGFIFSEVSSDPGQG